MRFQIDEIERAALDDPSEEVTLEAEETLLRDAAGHRDALAVAFAAIEGPAFDGVGTALSALADRQHFADLAARLRSAQAELGDIESELRFAGERIPDDPERLEAVEARRRQLRELQRKYGETLADVLAFAAGSRARVAELEGYEQRAAEHEASRATAASHAAAAALELSAARRAAAGRLGTAVTGFLRELAMPAAEVTVLVEPGEQGEDGADTVTFLLAPNPGEAPRPVVRAASGGELTRAMLALRLVLSEAPPTLVFDEVDAGIGGEAGTAVGRLLADLAQRHQVLCVTHLAQVAASADSQIVVAKREEEGRTLAGAAVVDGEARVSELSRMLAGVVDSAHARSHAVELLSTAHGTGHGTGHGSAGSTGSRRGGRR